MKPQAGPNTSVEKRIAAKNDVAIETVHLCSASNQFARRKHQVSDTK